MRRFYELQMLKPYPQETFLRNSEELFVSLHYVEQSSTRSVLLPTVEL